tara:strand:+ start:30 stop:446 length:417 start_codon:yes stop_codon:yes gene_type:complete
MAVTVINLSDPVSTLVTKSNTIASDLGDRATLATTANTNLVAAINEINTKVVGIDTEAEIAAQVETFFNTQGNVLDVRGFHADSANIDSATITSLATTTFRLDSVALQHAKALQIKDSTGSVVLAGFLLSTSNTDGTL